MQYKRSDRVAQQLLKEAAEILEYEVSDPRLGEVTVTAVTVSDDLRHARIYYSMPRDDNELEESIGVAFGKALGFIKRALAIRMQLRYMPEIAFQFDKTLKQARRIEDLLNSSPSHPSEGLSEEED